MALIMAPATPADDVPGRSPYRLEEMVVLGSRPPCLVAESGRHGDRSREDHPTQMAVRYEAALIAHEMALQEGTCDETPFEVLCFPFSIQHWHFVTKMDRTSCLLASEGGKTAGSCRHVTNGFSRLQTNTYL